MEKERLDGLMELLTKGILMITIFTVLGPTNGLMEESILETGVIIKCMEEVLLSGLMDADMKEVTLMIRKKDKVSLNGQMEENILAVG